MKRGDSNTVTTRGVTAPEPMIARADEVIE
jgi:hypothetical protein